MSADAKQFFAVHKVPDAERTLQQAVERIDACTTLRPRNRASWRIG